MKLLFDQNLSFKLCQALADLFPGSSQVRLLGLAEADDSVLWQHAKRVKTALSTANVQFNKRKVCRRIASDIRQMTTLSDMPEHTRLMAEQLFTAVAKAFSNA